MIITEYKVIVTQSERTGFLCVDIDHPKLISYCDWGNMHGLQCDMNAEHPNYKKVMDLCDKISALFKELHQLNKPENGREPEH